MTLLKTRTHTLGPGRVFLVTCWLDERRTRRGQRWLVDDFRLGAHRRRGDAVRAARRVGMRWVR